MMFWVTPFDHCFTCVVKLHHCHYKYKDAMFSLDFSFLENMIYHEHAW